MLSIRKSVRPKVLSFIYVLLLTTSTLKQSRNDLLVMRCRIIRPIYHVSSFTSLKCLRFLDLGIP